MRDRICRVRQQNLRALDSPLKMISKRWNSERLLESSTEMMLAEPSEPSQRAQGYAVVEMFLDVSRDSALLPAGKSAAARSFGPSQLLARARELVRKDTRERVEVECAFRSIALNHILQLGGRCPNNGILEECPRRIRGIRVDGFLQLGWSEVEIRHARGRTGLVRFAIGMTGRDERQLVGEISKPRRR